MRLGRTKSLLFAVDREAVKERILSLTPQDQRLWGKMSVHQMLCHLADSSRLALGEKSASPATGPLQRTIIKWAALYLPLPWPKDASTRPEMEQGVGGTAPTTFEDDRQRLLTTLSRFAVPDSLNLAIPHPIFGVLTREQWLRWAYLHADHHLRQFGR